MNDILANLGKGTYVLIFSLDYDKTIKIGEHGKFRFSAGKYAYIGSAQGNGGLKSRLAHHMNKIAEPHWHVDYFSEFAELEEIWYIESEKQFEHEWTNTMINMPGGIFYITGFGSSDCKCISHLFYFRDLPSFDRFTSLLEHYSKTPSEEVEKIHLFEHA